MIETKPNAGAGRIVDYLWGLRASVATLAMGVLVLRAASFAFGILNIDECDFAVIARTIRAGGLLYVDVADLKPPLVYLSFLPAAWLGDTAMRAVGALVVLATALVLRATARRWTGRDDVGWAAAWCTLLAGLVEVPAVNAEVLMNLPSAAALYCHVRATRGGARRWELAAGLLVGVASLYKHQAGVILAALALAVVHGAVRGPGERDAPVTGGKGARLVEAAARCALLAAGFALPWLATWAAYARVGHAAELLDWVIGRNVGYVGIGATSAWPRFLLSLAVCVAGAAPVPWFLAIREALRRYDPIRFALAALLALTWLPVGAGGRFYEHYFLQFVPPLALLAAPGLVALFPPSPPAGEAAGAVRSGRATRRLAGALLLLPVAGYLAFSLGRGLAGRYPGQDPTTRAVASWIRSHSAPDDRLFVWGHFSPIYCLSGRLPGTRYISTAWHVGNFDPEHVPATFDFAPYRSQRDVDLSLRDLEANRPALVVDTATAGLHRWSLFPLARFPELDGWIRAHYRPAAAPGGVTIYRRADPAP